MIVRIQGAEQIAQQIYYEYDTESMPLGQGGMGVVYLGRCVSAINGAYTAVAIKKIANDSPDLMMRAVMEASVQIEHPNLMRMWGFIPNAEWDPYTQTSVTRSYVVMEYLSGVNLESMLMGNCTDKQGQIVEAAQSFCAQYEQNRVSASVSIMKQILEGVAQLHASGFVHRDIDPSNVMITSEGNVKVIDFGVVKQMNVAANPFSRKLTNDGSIIGKMEYAAPEVVKGFVDVHNYSTDVYALGIVFFQLLTGSLPFTGNSEEVVKAQAEAAMPLHLVEDRALRRIIGKATQKEQSARYATAQDMLDDLEQYHQPKPTGNRKNIKGTDDQDPPQPPLPRILVIVGVISIIIGVIAALFVL